MKYGKGKTGDASILRKHWLRKIITERPDIKAELNQDLEGLGMTRKQFDAYGLYDDPAKFAALVADAPPDHPLRKMVATAGLEATRIMLKEMKEAAGR
jgi:hypothetical protein